VKTGDLMQRWKLIFWCVWWWGGFGSQFIHAQQIKPIEIPLGRNNPLQLGTSTVEILLDPKSSTDRVEQVEHGIEIEKITGKTSSPCGLVFKQGAKSIFTFSLELEVLQLSSPRTPGLQGLFVQFVLDRLPPNTTTFGLIGAGRGIRRFISYSGPEPKLNELQFEDTSFKKGTWLFSRESESIQLSVSEATATESMQTSFREIRRANSGPEPLKEIRIVCLRQDSAKPASEFLLKRLQFAGDEFYSQPAPKPPFWTATRIYSALFWICILVVVGYPIYRARQIKDWLVEKFSG
jgi:hypothetical protein